MIAEFLKATGHTKCEVPILLQLVENDIRLNRRVFGLNVLCCFTTDAREAVPSLRRLVNDPNQTIRRHAAWAIGIIEQNVDEIELLARRLGSPDDERAEFIKDLHEAIEQIGDDRETWQKLFGTDPEDTLEWMAMYMQFGTGNRKREMLRALVAIGPPAGKLASDVRALLRDPHEETRTLAAQALAAIQVR